MIKWCCLMLLNLLSGITIGQTLRLMSYNIHHANPPGKPGVIDMQAIAKLINEAEVDVVGIQEVDILVSRSEMQNQAELLSELTGMDYYFSKGINLEKGYYGTLILTKHKIIGKRRYDLPMPIASENRSLAILDIQLPDGKLISVANTHLDLKEENKIAQVKFINETVDLYSRPLILMGDLNARPESEPILILEEQFVRNTLTNSPTSPNIKPKNEIDYIMMSKNTAFQWIKYETIPEHEASDHLPLLAVIDLQ